MADWTSEYVALIDDCEKRQDHLTDWEIQFIDSLSGQLAKGCSPSPKQIETLDNIWQKATSKG